MKISEILRSLEQKAPRGTAEDWDNVGLLAGDPEWDTSGAVVTIDLSEQALELAEKKGVNLIINHHPCIFPKSRGLRSVNPAASPMARLVFEAVRRGVAVIACHTNFDRCALEVVEQVSKGLGAAPSGRLLDHPSGSVVKLSVFVPADHVDAVRDAICAAGAGQIGAYDFCTFGVRGEGTFRGSDQTKPFIGKPGSLERAEEVRLETVIPRGMEGPVLEAMRQAHPYEEIAYDLYPVEQKPASVGLTRGLGYGFWGDLAQPMSFSDVARHVKQLFEIESFWVTDPPPRQIRRVAYVAGKGASFVQAAQAKGCDLFITGEAGYHTALEASREGMSVMELGHRESERFFAPTMAGWVSELGLKAHELSLATQKIVTG